MSERDLEKMRKLDEVAEQAGGFVAPFTRKDTQYNYREITKYCKEKNIEPVDLTIRELNKFIIA